MAYSIRKASPLFLGRTEYACCRQRGGRNFENFLPLRQGTSAGRGSAYQYTPYLAAMRRALCSSVSRRSVFAGFAGLVSVVLVSVVLVSDLGSVLVAVVVVAAGAWVWAGAVVSVGAVAAWASCIEPWAVGFAGSAIATPARLRLRDSPAWAEADASSRAA